MNITAEYYNRILEIFIETYGEQIECAPEGHCMKVTGFTMEVLRDLYGRLGVLETTCKYFILSDDPDNTGDEYITPTKLVELRNDLTIPVLALVPINSSTAVEDSINNATFHELSIARMDDMLLVKLIGEMGGNSTIKRVLEFADRNLSVTVQDKINYLLYIGQNGLTDEAIGNGVCYLGLIPYANLTASKDLAPMYMAKNDDCVALLSDYSLSVADRVRTLPVKGNAIQPEVAKFLVGDGKNRSRKEMCTAIMESYPELNFQHWQNCLKDIPELGKLHVTKVELSSKTALSIIDDDLTMKVDAKKGAKAKLRIYFSPKPSAYEQLKKVRIALMNGDGFYKEADIKTTKITENTKEYRDVQVNIGNDFENGTYFFHVFAEDADGTVLNVKDEFQIEGIQRQWLEAEKKGVSKEDFQQQNRQLLTSDTETFFLKNADADDDDEGEEIGTRAKISNVLQAYFHYRIELNRKGKELDIPVRQAIVEKKGKVSKGSDDELKSWQFGTNIDTFQLRYDADNNYQIPLSKKLLEIEECILRNSKNLIWLDSTISDNATEEYLKKNEVHFFNEIPISTDLLKKRDALFHAILDSAPGRKGIDKPCGVIETFEVFNHIEEIKDYLETYREWLNEVSEMTLDQEVAVKLQSIDAVSLSVEMPNGVVSHTKMLTPLHPLRLAWLVNIYDQYTEWETRTHDDDRYRKPDVWYKKLDKLFYGDLLQEVAPLVMRDLNNDNYLQYVGELCFGWALYADPHQGGDDTFSTGFRQLKAYLSQMLNIAVQFRIDSDVNTQMVYRMLYKYIVQHPYTDKLIINLFNAGDAAVFAENLVWIERNTKDSPFDIHYEIRMFCDDKRFPQGEALKDLLNPDTQVSEEAENFSQADDNRLFPKLRFSINSIEEFLQDPHKYSAHLSFLINPFPTESSLKRSTTLQQSFYLNGIVTRPIVEVENSTKGYMWHRYMSETPMPNPVNQFGENSQKLYSCVQRIVAQSMTTDLEVSVPSITLNIKDANSAMLGLVHDISDWVITFDKNMGPEFYDLPCKKGETPYLLDYLPSAELNGISSFLTSRPTSEIRGMMAPHFKSFGIDVHNTDAFDDLLGDIRSVSSSMIMQLESTQNKAFEVLGTTLMKRMLKGKGLLEDTFIVPIDLHQELFKDMEGKSRADDMLVDLHVDKREIVLTIIEIKCRQELTADQLSQLEDKMQSQIKNTEQALRMRFDTEFTNPDRLDRELMTLELQSLLVFYCRRASRYGYLNEQTAQEYEKFIMSLSNGDYTLKFKELGLVYLFKSQDYQRKDYMDDTTYYIMGKPMIERILDRNASIKTRDIDMLLQDEEFKTSFETSDRLTREASLRWDSEEEPVEMEPIEVEPDPVVVTPETVVEHKSVVVVPEPVIEPESVVVVPESVVQPKTVIQPEPEVVIPQPPFEPEPVPAVELTPEPAVEVDPNYVEPTYDIMIGKTSGSEQFGILGESMSGHRKIAIDLSETNTISLFGVQGGGKSYTIGTVTEMTLKQFSNVNRLPAPMASIIFHYSESMDYAPEFTSMIYANDEAGQLKKLKDVYGAEAGKIDDVIMLCPIDKVEERQEEYPSLEIQPIAFHSTDLNVQDWMFLLKAVGNDSTYINQLRSLMRQNRKNLNLEGLKRSVEDSSLLSKSQKDLAMHRLAFAEEYIDDSRKLGSLLKPGRLIVVDLRDEFINQDDALGLFVIMLNIFSGVKKYYERPFNKFIVFDEAHKYMNNKELTGTIVTAIREMRHKGVSMMIASQDPMSLPTEIIELSSIMLMHKFNSPQWVKHVQKSITQLQSLSSSDMASLVPGEAYLWATKATDKGVTNRPMKISTRPRVTKHGGDTQKAI